MDTACTGSTGGCSDKLLTSCLTATRQLVSLNLLESCRAYGWGKDIWCLGLNWLGSRDAGKVINLSHSRCKQGGSLFFLLISISITILVAVCNDRTMEEAGNGVDACNSVPCCTSRGHVHTGFYAFGKVCAVQWLQQMALQTTSLVFPYTWVWSATIWRNMLLERFLSWLAWEWWVCSDILEFRSKGKGLILFIVWVISAAWPKQTPTAGGVVRHHGGPEEGGHFVGGVWREKEGEEREKFLGFKKKKKRDMRYCEVID